MKKKLKKQTSVCKCGAVLPYITTTFYQNEQRICPKCGRKHYVDSCPIDWDRISKPIVNRANQKV